MSRPMNPANPRLVELLSESRICLDFEALSIESAIEELSAVLFAAAASEGAADGAADGAAGGVGAGGVGLGGLGPGGRGSGGEGSAGASAMGAGYEMKLQGASEVEFRHSALNREQQFSTCLGEGLAVPHGELPAGSAPVAVLGVQGRGLPFDGPDGKAVQVVALLGVPVDQRELHVLILAGIARGLGQNQEVREALGRAASPAEVLKLLADAD